MTLICIKTGDRLIVFGTSGNIMEQIYCKVGWRCHHKMISKIFVAMDGSESSVRAYEYASFLAKKCDAALLIVNILIHSKEYQVR